MSAPSDAMRRLALDANATFALSRAGRIVSENDPDRSTGPRLYLAGCAGGNLVLLRHDVDKAVARRVRDFVASEPPWTDPDRRPACLCGVVGLLSGEAPAEVGGPAVIHALAPGLRVEASARIIDGESPEGRRLRARLAADGAPPHLVAAGFVGVGDFWPPWCVAMAEGEVAAIAFAARSGPAGASIGVYTFPGFRGRGLASAVTARWASLPSLRGQALSYSADWANAASIGVIRRLRLPRIGVSLRLGPY